MVAEKKKGRTIFALEKENVQYYTTRSTANHKADWLWCTSALRDILPNRREITITSYADVKLTFTLNRKHQVIQVVKFATATATLLA